MEEHVVPAAKLALYAGALAGPMSVVALLLVGLFIVPEGLAFNSLDALELVSVAVVGLFFGVIIAVAFGFPIFWALSRLGRREALLVAVWGAVLGGASYHWIFMAGSEIAVEWVAVGALAGFLAGGTAAVCLQRTGRRRQHTEAGHAL
jgi:hypothetical protein